MRNLTCFARILVMTAAIVMAATLVVSQEGNHNARKLSFVNHHSTLTHSKHPTTPFVTDLQHMDSTLESSTFSILARSAESTTTTTITAPIVTMTDLNSSLAPVDHTTLHLSTTIPPMPSPSSSSDAYEAPVNGSTDSTSNMNSITGITTIFSSGNPVPTITSLPSSFTVKPPLVVSSAISLATTPKANTTEILPFPTLSVTSSTIFLNSTISMSHVPTITSFSMTTVDPPVVTQTDGTAAPTAPVATGSPSTTETLPNGTTGTKNGYTKVGMTVLGGLIMNVVLAAIL